MRVSEVMTRNVHIADPEQSLQDVARVMAECNLGCVPVGDSERLIGMLTDRDIAIRAVAAGKSPAATKVKEIMSKDVKYCFEDEDISHIAKNMGDIQVHRLPVVDRKKRLVGILALADIATGEGPELAGIAIHGISCHGEGRSSLPLS